MFFVCNVGPYYILEANGSKGRSIYGMANCGIEGGGCSNNRIKREANCGKGTRAK